MCVGGGVEILCKIDVDSRSHHVCVRLGTDHTTRFVLSCTPAPHCPWQGPADGVTPTGAPPHGPQSSMPVYRSAKQIKASSQITFARHLHNSRTRTAEAIAINQSAQVMDVKEKPLGLKKKKELKCKSHWLVVI